MKKYFNMTMSFDRDKDREYVKEKAKFRNVRFLGDDCNVSLQFENCKFKNCEFGYYLQGSSFRNCTFKDCRFHAAMDGTVFEDCHFTGGIFDAKIRHGKIKNTVFDGVDFEDLTDFLTRDVIIESVRANACIMPQHSLKYLESMIINEPLPRPSSWIIGTGKDIRI